MALLGAVAIVCVAAAGRAQEQPPKPYPPATTYTTVAEPSEPEAAFPWWCAAMVVLPLGAIGAGLGHRYLRRRERERAGDRISRAALVAYNAATGSVAHDRARAELETVAPALPERREALARGFADACYAAVASSVPTDRDLETLRGYLLAFDPDQRDPRVADALLAISFVPAVRELLGGRVPQLPSDGPPPGLVPQRGERFVWSTHATGYEYRKRAVTYHDDAGALVPIGGGIYVGAKAGRSVTQEFDAIARSGQGILVFTTAHMIFVGAATTLRIPYTQVTRVRPAVDGLELQLDSHERPLFAIHTGSLARAWLSANLAMNLPNAN